MQALFYLKTLAVVAAITSFMFHVKHYEQFQHFLSALKFSITFLENNQQTPPHPNFYKIYVDNILINVEKLLKRESRKICLHIFHDRAAGFALVQNLLRFECGEHACMFYIFKPPKVGLAQKLLKRESRKICWRVFAVLTNLSWDTSCPTCSCSVMFHVKRLVLFLCRESFDE